MKILKLRTFFLGSLLLATLILSFTLVNKPTQSTNRDNIFRLQAPPFVSAASAATAPADVDIGTLLDEEAGISAWFQAPDLINLSQVRGQFRTIETETDDYIIGSVPVPDHVEHFDVHVYVHRDGWILAYYLRSDPTSKIVDVKGMTINTTKLKTVVAAVAGAAGAPFADVTYYDFRYPNATNMMLIAEDKNNGNDFTIQLPSSFGYFERGWALYAGCTWTPPPTFRVDGTNKVGQATWNGGCAYYGVLTASELLPDTTHTVVVDGYQYGYGVLVITYRVP